MGDGSESAQAAGRVLVALDSSVGVGAAAFAGAWEGDVEARRVGSPVVEPVTGEVFVPGVLELIVIPLLVNVGSSGLYDLVKRLVAKARSEGRAGVEDVEVAEVMTAEGDRLVVVRSRRELR